MANNVQGNVTGIVKFKIDNASWKALDLFQKKLTSVKRQMSGLDKTIKMKAIVQEVTAASNKITNNNVKNIQREAKARQDAAKKGGVGLEFGKAKGSDKTYASWWTDTLKQQTKDMRKATADAIREQRRSSRQLEGNAKNMSKADSFDIIKRSQVQAYGVGKDMSQADIQKMMSTLEQQRTRARSMATGSDGTLDLMRYRAELNASVREMTQMDRAARRNAMSFRSLRTDLVQMTAAYTAFSGVVNIAQSGMELEGIRAAAKVFAGDEAGVAEHMKYIADQTDRLGINFMVAAKEFNKFSIAVGDKMPRGTTRSIFEGISEYATVLQVDQQQYERAMRSVVQMISKQQIYAEELRGCDWLL